MADRFTADLARLNNGAIQVDSPRGLPLFAMLAGPIKVWWTEWDSPRHRAYVTHRDATEAFLVGHGILVYKPHTAWRGAWHEGAQHVNNEAVKQADVLIDLTPRSLTTMEPLVPCEGTSEEVSVAEAVGTTVVLWPEQISAVSLETWFNRLFAQLVKEFPDRVYK